MKKHLFTLVLVLLACMTAAAQTISSPNGRLTLQFSLDSQGVPHYALTYDGKTVVGESRMGFIIKENIDFGSGFSVASHEETTFDETWQPVLGQYRDIRDHHNEFYVSLVQKQTDRVLGIRFRLFDDGLGFRYEFPVQQNLHAWGFQEELTEFRLSGDHKAFWIPADYDTNEFPITTSRLSEIAGLIDEVRTEALACKSPTPNLAVQTPLMLKSADGLYINIHEAALVDFPAMHLNLDDQTFTFSAHLTPDKNGTRGYAMGGSHTPWRTIVVSNDARDILASSLILNLNEPCKIEDTSWIHPTKYVGVWWEYFTGGGSTWAYSDYLDGVPGESDYSQMKPNGHHGANTEHVKEYIDFAARNGLDAVLVEGWNEGWEANWAGVKDHIYSFTKAYPDFDVEELHRYAASKGVRIIMHHETTSAVCDYEWQMRDAFRFMNDNGYDAVKTGYVGPITPRSEHHDGQWMVRHYVRVAEEAAKHHIMVDSHEAVRPTGVMRTWPNWVAQESARGTEFESFNGNRPDHTTILPFTRLMGGPMDYTPGIFEGDLSVYGNNKAKLSTTLTKQLALYVTMYSPLQMAADLYPNYEKHSDAFQFIRDVAADWDDTRVLEAEPGDYITIARKAKGKDEWYVGAITDENARTATIDLSFLPKGEKFVATIYADAKDADWQKNPKAYTITTKKVSSKTVLKQWLARSGGAAISIKRAGK